MAATVASGAGLNSYMGKAASLAGRFTVIGNRMGAPLLGGASRGAAAMVLPMIASTRLIDLAPLAMGGHLEGACHVWL